MFGTFRPPLFLLTALLWLVASAALGLYGWVAKEIGWPLPPLFRVIHVHMALVGGVTQMIFGALLMFLPPLLLVPFEEKKSRGVQYVLLNGGTAGLLIGFGLANLPLVGVFGAAVGLACVMLFVETLAMVRRSIQRTGLQVWFYGLAVLAWLVGIGLAESIAFGAFTPDRVNLVRLAHVHLNLLGFVTLTVVGTGHTLFPTIAGAPLYSQRLALATFVLLSLGMLGLVGGFLMAEPLAQVGAGLLVLAGALCYGWNVLGTWRAAETKSSLPVLHLLCATGWLLGTAAGGLFLAWNGRTVPPPVPIGTAHVMGYSHMALVGFILQTIMGALGHLLPVVVALARVKSRKKRGPYLERLTGLIESGKWVQLAALNLGIVAMLGWGVAVSLSGLHTELTITVLGIAAGLLLAALALFVGNVTRLLATRPGEPEATAA
jgi:hypothetical protein